MREGEHFQTLLGATGTRQDDDDGGGDRAGAAARARDRPQQDARGAAVQRVQGRSSPRTRWSTSFVLLRLLPARGLRPQSPTSTSRRTPRSIQEVDRLRHAATAAVFARRDVIVVASVSCIYGLGSPETYELNMQILKPRRARSIATKLLRKLVSDPVPPATTPCSAPRQLPRARRDARGLPGLCGDRVPGRACSAMKSSACTPLRPAHRRGARGGSRARRDLARHPLHHVREGMIEDAVAEIGRELEPALYASSRRRARCSRPTACASARSYDMEMLLRDGLLLGDRELLPHPRRPPARRAALLPDRLLPEGLRLLHRRVSPRPCRRSGGMHEGDRSRKQTLVDYGFRLPSALDNRPQTFEEFLGHHATAAVRLGDAGGVRAGPARRAWWSRSSGPPGSWIRPRGRARDHAIKSTT